MAKLKLIEERKKDKFELAQEIFRVLIEATFDDTKQIDCNIETPVEEDHSKSGPPLGYKKYRHTGDIFINLHINRLNNR